MLENVRRILGMIRFSHTLFALPFAMLSAVLAWHSKPQGFCWLELTAVLLCMVFARSAAMAFNRLADRRIDAENPRTANRHLPSGQLSVGAVWLFTLTCGVAFIASTALFLWAEPSNPWPLILAVPVLLFVCLYSYTKRFTSLAHFWLGVSLLLAPVSAWIAIRAFDQIEIAVVVGLAVLFWVAGFDIIYACQDVDFDRKTKLASIPVRFGVRGALRIAFVCHLVMIALLVALYWVAMPYLGWIYFAGVGLAAGLILFEHALVKADDLSRVNQAFFHVNAVISIGLLAVVLVQILVK